MRDLSKCWQASTWHLNLKAICLWLAHTSVWCTPVVGPGTERGGGPYAAASFILSGASQTPQHTHICWGVWLIQHLSTHANNTHTCGSTNSDLASGSEVRGHCHAVTHPRSYYCVPSLGLCVCVCCCDCVS